MVGCEHLRVMLHHQVLPVHSHHHSVMCELKVLVSGRIPLLHDGVENCYVHQVLDVGSTHSCRSGSQQSEVDLVSKFDLFREVFKKLCSSSQVREGNLYLLVETTCSHDRFVQSLGSVGGSNHNNLAVSLKTVHFSEDLVQFVHGVLRS